MAPAPCGQVARSGLWIAADFGFEAFFAANLFNGALMGARAAPARFRTGLSGRVFAICSF
jgi:hypothetical protein